MTTKLVKGTPVVSLADGAKLGTIDHVYFDPSRLAVVGFTFHQRGGLFGGGSSGLIDISDVQSFGPDAVTVPDVSVVRSELAVDAIDCNLLDLETLLNRTVMTVNGTLVGRVAAIQFGDASHALTALDVIGEGTDVHGSIAASEIQTIGPELIIVADPATVATTVHVRPRQVLHEVTPDASEHRRLRPVRDLEVLGA